MGQPYAKEKFTTNELRDDIIDNEPLALLFKKILEAERHAQIQQCYFSPCGIIPESSDPWLSNSDQEDGESSSSILLLDKLIFLLIVFLHIE